MPLIILKRQAREYENDLKRQIKTGAFLKDSDLKNFAKFFNEIYMDYSRKHKTPLSTQFDKYYGKRLLRRVRRKNALSNYSALDRELPCQITSD